MAQNRYGSFFVQKLFEKADVKRKEKIVKKLLEISPKLMETSFGRVMIVKYVLFFAEKTANKY